MKPYFLNVDLEIESTAKLNSLAADMGKRVTILYCGPSGTAKRHLLKLENSRQYKGPDAATHALCAIIESLSPAARRVWDAASKVFDIGYELRPNERASRFTLRSDTLQRVASLGATLAVSFYRGVSTEAMLQERDQQRDAQIDRVILALVGARWMKVAMVVLKVSANEEMQLPKGGEGYDLVAGRIEALVRDGHLMAQGDIKKWRHSEVRRPGTKTKSALDQ